MWRSVMGLVVGLVILAHVPAWSADEGKWESIFNGTDLTGWTPKITGFPLGENYADTFRVGDGCLQVRYDKYTEFAEKFGHIFYKEKLGHYRVRLEYRFVGEQCKGGPGWALRNSGIMLHCQAPESLTLKQKFPVSIEFQLLGGNGKDDRTTANMCSPGTNIVVEGKLYTPHILNSKSKTFHGDQWVTVEAEVHGADVIKHYVNGELVMQYEQPQYDPKDADAKPLIKEGNLLIKEGYISLQAESHPCDFRKIEIMKLKE
jgi:hypothetical protein